MNRRQFIAGLMASTVAPAPPVPIMKRRSLGMTTLWSARYYPQERSIWWLLQEYERQHPRAFNAFGGSIGEYRGVIIRDA